MRLVNSIVVMISLLLSLAVAGAGLTGCSKNTPVEHGASTPTRAALPPEQLTRVIVLGTIHTRHQSSKQYPLSLLINTVRAISPDMVLTEIPPDRFDDALQSYRETGAVNEPRVARFPEYTDAIFPLHAELGFTLVPAASWTQPMAEARSLALNKIARDPTRADDWAAYTIALDRMNDILTGKEEDPFFIHTDRYDAIIKEGLSPYATLFAGQLGTGDWEQINRAHFELISQALDQITGSGKTVVITFGAAHKYWFREQLALRSDIKLVSPQPYLEAAITPKPDLR